MKHPLVQGSVALSGMGQTQVIVAHTQSACEIVAKGDYESNQDEAAPRDQLRFGSHPRHHRPTASCARDVATGLNGFGSKRKLNGIT